MTDDIPEDVMAVALKISLNDYRYGRVYDGEMPPNTYAVQRAVDIARAILAERERKYEPTPERIERAAIAIDNVPSQIGDIMDMRRAEARAVLMTLGRG